MLVQAGTAMTTAALVATGTAAWMNGAGAIAATGTAVLTCFPMLLLAGGLFAAHAVGSRLIKRLDDASYYRGAKIGDWLARRLQASRFAPLAERLAARRTYTLENDETKLRQDRAHSAFMDSYQALKDRPRQDNGPDPAAARAAR